MLDHDSSIPLYAQVKELLAEQIVSGRMRPNEKLPSERELCDKYNVSRLTIRQALHELKNENLVYTAQGKGTFAKKPLITQRLSRVVSFEKTLQSRGVRPSTKVLHNRMLVNHTAAAFLQVDPDTPLYNVCILGYGNNEPFVYYISYTREEVGHMMYGIARDMEKQGRSYTTYELYEAAGIELDSSIQMIDAVNADATLAKILSVPRDFALLRITSKMYKTSQEPIEYKIAHYCGNQYSFQVNRQYV